MDLRKLSIEHLSELCAQESESYRRGSQKVLKHCMEIFRRAIICRADDAWQCIYTHYKTRVSRWVRAHSAYPKCNEEVVYFVNSAFSKFWHAVTPDKFSRFETVGNLLKYLKLCVASVLLDHLRRLDKATHLQELEAQSRISSLQVPSAELQLEQDADAQDIWDLIQSQLKSDTERMIAQSIFLYNMSPREILAQNPGLFEQPKSLYRAIENIMKRLRRNPELQRWLANVSTVSSTDKATVPKREQGS